MQGFISLDIEVSNTVRFLQDPNMILRFAMSVMPWWPNEKIDKLPGEYIFGKSYFFCVLEIKVLSTSYVRFFDLFASIF